MISSVFVLLASACPSISSRVRRVGWLSCLMWGVSWAWPMEPKAVCVVLYVPAPIPMLSWTSCCQGFFSWDAWHQPVIVELCPWYALVMQAPGGEGLQLMSLVAYSFEYIVVYIWPDITHMPRPRGPSGTGRSCRVLRASLQHSS